MFTSSLRGAFWGSMPVQARVTGGGRLLVAGQSFAVADRALGRTTAGPLSLKDPRIAGQVAAAIHIGEWERQFYDLHAWVIMPNHVHLLVLPEKAFTRDHTLAQGVNSTGGQPVTGASESSVLAGRVL